MKHILTNFHDNRYQWAFDARNEFIKRFVRLNPKKVDQSTVKELTISVYGPTQVGKTTIILSLLGIKEEKLAQLSTWLRGKRDLGKSSTITVMLYIKSPDSYFHVQLPNGDVKADLTGDQLEAELENLRATIETGSTYSVEPVVIEIPLAYFEASDANINIVDLPGAESVGISEIAHVKQCLKHWIPLSEVCLLVDDATQLTAYSQLALDEIKYWYNQLENFRIIPTRALSLESVKDDFRKGKIVSAKGLIDDYAKVLNRSLKKNLDLSKTIYPIDIGNSRETMRVQEPALYNKTSAIMKEIAVKLKSDLMHLNVNELTFNRLTQFYRQAEEASKVELLAFDSRIEKSAKMLIRHEFQLDMSDKHFYEKEAEVLKEYTDYEEFLNKLDEHINHFGFIDVEELANEGITYNEDKRNYSVLNAEASSLQYELVQRLEKVQAEVESDTRRLQVSLGEITFPEIVPPALLDRDKKEIIFKRSYRKIIKQLRLDVSFRIEEMVDPFVETFINVHDHVSIKADSVFNELDLLRRAYDKNRSTLQDEINKEVDIKQQLMTQREEAKRLWEQDCDHAKKLQTYFIEHWLLYKHELEELFLHGRLEERWLASQYLQLLQVDGTRIIESLNIRGESDG